MNNLLRLNKYIAQSTGVSRRRADDLISTGHVKVNDVTIYELGTKVLYGRDKVTVYNKEVTPRSYVYYALNKPVGYTSTRLDPFAKHKVIDLVPNNPAVYPVGRLDKNSQGLLLMTNDGNLTNKITHPSSHIEKEYFIDAKIVRDGWDVRQLHKLERGLSIDGVKIAPAKVFGWNHEGKKVTFYIILGEGKKRQIRRMAQKIGLEVDILRRVRMGKLRLGDLKPGQYRVVKPSDIL